MLFNIMKHQRRRCKICSFLNSRNPYFRKTQTNISHEQIPTSSDYTLMCAHYSINVEINRPSDIIINFNLSSNPELTRPLEYCCPLPNQPMFLTLPNGLKRKYE